ncbi:hypothetical protein ABIB57_003657 [Devosia sp. UYZn731]|uniref:hypothetical protein n=1 Tax=Devosia sp. UYZn731 TaxID=3156345 RepID=UPI003391C757
MTTEGNTSGAVGPHAKNSREELRKQVVLTIVEACRAGIQQGKSYTDVLIDDYRDVPAEVIFEVEDIMGREQDEAWWASVERTIDAEIINGAIRAKGGEQGE